MTRWAQEGWQGTAHVQPGGRNPRSQLLAGLALFQCILSQRLDARALGEKMGYLVVLGEVWCWIRLFHPVMQTLWFAAVSSS